jgi:hypothetical protein
VTLQYGLIATIPAKQALMAPWAISELGARTSIEPGAKAAAYRSAARYGF